MKGAGHRRSARISVLEEKARLLALQTKTKRQVSDSISNVSSATAKRKGCKRKSLQEVVVKSATVSTHFQEAETSKDEDTSKKADQPENDSSSQRMPKKQTLEFILDILQRRDTEELFAQPVDCDEVEGYYNVVKEPMDFGTMRAKLQEGMYTSLEQFERDVFLISSNAMKFNSSTTLFYKEAQSISELAQRLFHSLKTEPENFDLEYSRTRRRPGKQPQEEAGGSNAELCKPGRGNGVRITSVKRNTSRYLTSSRLNRNINHTYTKGRSITRVGRGSSSSDIERRKTYLLQASFPKKNDPIFSAIDESPKQLNYVRGVGMRYTDSLLQFVKDLGPTAQRVANKKLEKLSAEATNLPSRAPKFSGNISDGVVLALPQQIVKDLRPTTIFVNDKPRTSATEATKFPSLIPTSVQEKTPTIADRTAANLVSEPSERIVKDVGLIGNISASIRHGKLSTEAPNFPSLTRHFPGNNAAKKLVPEESETLFKDLRTKAQMFADTRQSRLPPKAPTCLSLTDLTRNHDSKNLVSEQSSKSSKDLKSMMQLEKLGMQKFLPVIPNFPVNHTADNLIPKRSDILLKDLGPKTPFLDKMGTLSSETSEDQLLAPKFSSNQNPDCIIPQQSAKFDNKQGSMNNMFMSNDAGGSSSQLPNFLQSNPIFSWNRTKGGLVSASIGARRPARLNEFGNEQLSQDFGYNSPGYFKGKAAFSTGGTSTFNTFDRPVIPIPIGEQRASTHVQGRFNNISLLLGERTANTGRDWNSWSSPKEKNMDTGDSMDLLMATLMQHNKFKSQANHTKSIFDIPRTNISSRPIGSSNSLLIINPSEPFSSSFHSYNFSNQGNNIFFHGLVSQSPNVEGLNAISPAALGPEYGAKSAQGQALNMLNGTNLQHKLQNESLIFQSDMQANDYIPSLRNALFQQQSQGRPIQEAPSLGSFRLFEGALPQNPNAQPTAQCFCDVPQPSFLDDQQPDLALEL